MRNLGIVWTIAKQTVPLCVAKGTLHDGVNISVCENNSKWLVFSDPVTYLLIHATSSFTSSVLVMYSTSKVITSVYYDFVIAFMMW